MEKTLRLLLCLLCVFVIFSAGDFRREVRKTEVMQEKWKRVKPAITEKRSGNDLREYRNVNPDLCGLLVFDSGLICLPVVQGEDNSFYLNHDFDGRKSSMGTPFLDVRSSWNDTGKVIYGHHVFRDENMMFSPLLRLSDEEVFGKNRTFHICRDEMTYDYEILYVLEMPVGDMDRFELCLSEYESEAYFDEFRAYLEAHDLNASDRRLEYDDRYLVLMTCAGLYSGTRFVVVAAEEA